MDFLIIDAELSLKSSGYFYNNCIKLDFQLLALLYLLQGSTRRQMVDTVSLFSAYIRVAFTVIINFTI